MSILPAICRDGNLDRNRIRIWSMKVPRERDEHQIHGISKLAQTVVILVEVVVVVAEAASRICSVVSGQVQVEQNVDY